MNKLPPSSYSYSSSYMFIFDWTLGIRSRREMKRLWVQILIFIILTDLSIWILLFWFRVIVLNGKCTDKAWLSGGWWWWVVDRTLSPWLCREIRNQPVPRVSQVGFRVVDILVIAATSFSPSLFLLCADNGLLLRQQQQPRWMKRIVIAWPYHKN